MLVLWEGGSSDGFERSLMLESLSSKKAVSPSRGGKKNADSDW